ncbi:MAG TPA: hypothetical protein VL221_03365 [Bacteroidota bacterium]|nr:hypothetical protein [Bacteroidota bacterium]
MLIPAKQRIFLWVPSLMFVALVLGRFEPTATGLVYRVMENGCVSALFLLVADGFLSVAEVKSTRTGIVMWLLALVALFALKHIPILTFRLI